MAKDINLTSQKWNDIIFEYKDKDYGAYELRSSSAKRHIVAFGIVAAIVVLVALLPKLIETVSKLRPAPPVTISESTVLSEIKTIDEDIKKQDEIVHQVINEPPPALKSTIQFIEPEIVPDEEIHDSELLKSQDELQESTAQVSLFDVEGTDEELGIDLAELEGQLITAGQGGGRGNVFDVVEQMPQFPGGERELMKYLRNNVRYPPIAAQMGIQGTVTMRFTVMSDGTIGNITILKGVDSSLDKEATRVISNMPKWIPGRQNGQAVNVNFTVPIHFKLE